MSAVLTRPHSTAPSASERPVPEVFVEKPAAVALDGRPGSAAFAALLGAYRSSGGTARGDDLARLLAEHRQGDHVSLARLIVAGEVFGFEWRQTLWIPMFQFDSRDLAVKAGRAASACRADRRSSTAWALAAWFANGNTWLDGQRPLDLLDRDLPAVLNAARADRFIAGG